MKQAIKMRIVCLALFAVLFMERSAFFTFPSVGGRRSQKKDPLDATVTHTIALEMQIGKYKYVNPLRIGLFGYDVPKTVDNFLQICTRKNLYFNDTKLTFDRSLVHRIIPDFMMQAGDFTNGDGTGGMSIFGEKFEDENFNIKHDKGVLSMANSGEDTNGSQFFITFKKTKHLDGKHVVFGRLLDGWKLLKKIEEEGTKDGTTKEVVAILRCYEIKSYADDENKCLLEEDEVVGSQSE